MRYGLYSPRNSLRENDNAQHNNNNNSVAETRKKKNAN